MAVVQDAHAIAKAANQYMGLFYVFVGVMLVFGAVLAFALIFSTIVVNIFSGDQARELTLSDAGGA